MSNAKQVLEELREEIAEFGNLFALIVDIATIYEQLSQRAELGLTEFVINSVTRFTELEASLLNYKNICVSS